jgi:uncharacterized protein YukE
MSDEIRVVVPYVRDLHTKVVDTSDRLRGKIGDVENAISSDPDLDGKLHDFMQDWDKRRRQVADTLDAVASALHAIDDSFTQNDDKMAAQINGGGA